MKTGVKIAGFVQARDEWPFLAVSISHALMYHVDEVYVLDHMSTDGTLAGLHRLQELWKDRIHVFRLHDDHFWQEASTNALIDASRCGSLDWIYVFDADEFLLTRDGASLRDLLGALDPKHSAVRYEVQNWIAPTGFDETRPADYGTLRCRAVANIFLELYPETYSDEIWHGNLNYFDVPFSSKLIFRNSSETWVTVGAHFVNGPGEIETAHLGPDDLRAAHVPFRSESRLAGKSKHGEDLVRERFPPDHGWQDQLVHRFSNEGLLGEFWASHSVPDQADAPGRESSNGRTRPSYAIDLGLVQALEPVLRLLADEFDQVDARERGGAELALKQAGDTQIPFRVAVHSARKQQRIADVIRRERDDLIRERDALARERDGLIGERDALTRERDGLVGERDALTRERDALAGEREGLLGERDALAGERDALTNARDALVGSRTWRYTRFPRWLRAHVRRDR